MTMQHMYKQMLYVTLIFTLLSLSSCSSTKLVKSWSDTGYSGKPLEKILVLGVMEKDLHRRMYEDAFVQYVKKSGLSAVAGYTLMPDLKEYEEKDEVRKAVAQSGADAVLMATLIGVENKEVYVPPSWDYAPSFGFGYGFYDYYGMSYRAAYRPGYMTTRTVVKLETTVFATDSDTMLWAGATESFNPSSPERVVRENADIIIKSMKKAGLLVK